MRFPPDRPTGRPVLWAHRGARAERPENTLDAFQRALDVGADAIETDVQLTRDGHVVIFHDDVGRRIAGVDSRVADTSLDELRTWDVGHAFVDAAGGRPFVGNGYHAPTLDEALAVFPSTSFNVDLKPGTRDAAIAAIRVIDAHGAADRVLLTSFDSRAIRMIRELGYRGPTGSGVRDVLQFVARPTWAIGPGSLAGDALQIPHDVGGVRVPVGSLVKKCRAAGVRLDVFTINDPAQAARLFVDGVDGIMTDDPARVAKSVRGETI